MLNVIRTDKEEEKRLEEIQRIAEKKFIDMIKKLKPKEKK
jgi:hypothetical protein